MVTAKGKSKCELNFMSSFPAFHLLISYWPNQVTWLSAGSEWEHTTSFSGKNVATEEWRTGTQSNCYMAHVIIVYLGIFTSVTLFLQNLKGILTVSEQFKDVFLKLFWLQPTIRNRLDTQCDSFYINFHYILLPLIMNISFYFTI